MNSIVLDRDGVINEDSKEFVRGLNEWRPIPGSIQAIADLSAAGFSVVVATNQSGLGRGLFSLEDMQAIHRRLRQLVEALGGEVKGIFHCPHRPEDSCSCRKPGVGLLQAAERDLAISVRGAWFVGDSLTDLQSARTYGCIPVLVKTGNGLATLKSLHTQQIHSFPDNSLRVYDNLAGVARALLQEIPAPKSDR
ncbi:MAG: D-glycero-beta-D-manno-heptose 1,7-bisphosphate 7-phosphatase [Pseudomonadota bacterium]